MNTQQTTQEASRRIVLAAWGSHGDVLPFIGLGKQLRALGHRPVLAASSHYQSLALGHGLDFAPVAPHHAQSAHDLGMGVDEVMQRAFAPLSGGLFLIKKLMLPYVEQTFQDLDAACEDADFLIAHPSVPLACMVAHKRALPWQTMVVQPFPLSAMSVQDPPVVSNLVPMHKLKLKDLIGERGYAAVFAAAKAMGRGLVKPLDDRAKAMGIYDKKQHPLYERVFSPMGTIALFSPELMRQPLPTDLPQGLHYAGFSYFDGGQSALPLQLQAFLEQGDPPIAFTLGSSAAFHADTFFSRCSDICKEMGVRAVFLVAGNAIKRALPPSQIAVAWVSVAALFPHCRAVVNAGGIGSCAQSLRAGLPQLMSDQALRRASEQLRDRVNQTCGTAIAADMVDRVLKQQPQQQQPQAGQQRAA